MNACRQGNAVFIGMIFLSLILLFKALIYLLSYRSEQKNVSVGIFSYSILLPNQVLIIHLKFCTSMFVQGSHLWEGLILPVTKIM